MQSNADIKFMETRKAGVLIGLENRDGLITRVGSIPTVSAKYRKVG